MAGNMDPLGQVAQLLGVHKSSVVRSNSAATVEPEKSKIGKASLVHVSHSGAALSAMADRLRAVGFVHNPQGAEQHEHRPPPNPRPFRDKRASESDLEGASGNPHQLKEFAESDEARAERHKRQKELTQDEVKEVRRLKDLDTKVKTHEMAHKVAAGSLAAGGPYYEYEQGPDGVNYAVAGHVPIHVPETDDPEQALRDSEKARRAALAPADPSPSDRAAAAQFSSRAATARQELAKERQAQGDVGSFESSGKQPRASGTEATSPFDDVRHPEKPAKALEAHRHPEFLLGRDPLK